jgi:phosphate transport system substrate-binding protein
MTDEQMKAITKYHVLHFPTVLGGVVPVYNLGGVSTELKFSGETLANIYLGNIKKWNDAAVNWPVGLGGKGNEGVAGLVKQTPYSIGYVELIYAAQNKMPFGQVMNAAGTFVKAGLNTVTEAASGAAKNMPADFRVSITNAPGKNAYPISSFTWLLIPSKIDNAQKKAAIVDFLKWMLTTGQQDCARLSYAPLPRPVVAKVQQQIASIQ